jgi:hypothetical protein
MNFSEKLLITMKSIIIFFLNSAFSVAFRKS